MSYLRSIDSAVIPLGADTSAAVILSATKVLVGIITPAALTGANISLEQSVDDGATWLPVYNCGSAYSVAIGTSRYIALNREVLYGIRLIRLVSDATEVAARTFQVISID